MLSVDATELTGLDDLHAPEGPIFEAEALLADLYHAKKVTFSSTDRPLEILR